MIVFMLHSMSNNRVCTLSDCNVLISIFKFQLSFDFGVVWVDSLSDNEIGDKGAKSIGEGVKHSTTLKSLV